MAVFSTVMPPDSGDDIENIAQLRAWACKLVGELRSLIYALDEQNVLRSREALKVMASGIEGVLAEGQIPDIDISKVKGNRPYCIVEPGTDMYSGFTIAQSNDDDELSELAHIYYDENSQSLVLYSVGNITVASTGVTRLVADGGIITNNSLTVNNTITADGIDVNNWLNVNGNPVTGNSSEEGA